MALSVKIPKFKRRDVVLVVASMIIGSLVVPIFLKVLPFLIVIAALGFLIKIVHETGIIKALLAERASSTAILPSRDYFSVSQKAINYHWSTAFYENFEVFVQGSDIYTDENYGLIYYFIIDSQIRYIGQTKSNTLRWRMTKKQESGCIGYNYHIKRNMLQAASEGRLSIRTHRIPKTQLDQYEKAAIETYALTNKLWNQEHNHCFDKSNFYQ